MDRVVDILMERDGLTRQEAEELVAECRGACLDCLAEDDYAGAEDAVYEMLGLELDYVVDILCG